MAPAPTKKPNKNESASIGMRPPFPCDGYVRDHLSPGRQLDIGGLGRLGGCCTTPDGLLAYAPSAAVAVVFGPVVLDGDGNFEDRMQVS